MRQTNANQIAKYKGQARAAYYAYMGINAGSAGHTLSEFICSDKAAAKVKFNECMQRLEELDPNAPKGHRL